MKLKSIAALYMASPEWHDLSVATRRIYTSAMRTLARFMEMDADDITRPMIVEFRDDLYDKSATCRLAVITLNNILRFGYDRGHCSHNHAANMRHMPKTIPIPRWTPEECELFLSKDPPDYIRIAFMLALYTGQRKSDLIRMKWDQYDGKYIRVRQQKTKRSLRIPVHPILKVELDRLKENPTHIRMGRSKRVPSPYILHNYYGNPWTVKSVYDSIKRWAGKLGIKNRTIHGLRKTTAAKLAEAGCSPHMIGAITGHTSLKELMNYTSEADQVRMADDAMERWINA